MNVNAKIGVVLNIQEGRVIILMYVDFVTLASDIRKDDCESIIAAIKMVKGVAGVKIHAADVNDWMARKQVREELKDKIYEWMEAL